MISKKATNQTINNNNNDNDVLKRLNALYKSYITQRIQLELNIETKPRESRYSNELLDQMRLEEELDNQIDRTIDKKIDRQVDRHLDRKLETYNNINNRLTAETSRYFNVISNDNIKKWINLINKLNKDRLKSKIDSSLDNNIPLIHSAITPTNNTSTNLTSSLTTKINSSLTHNHTNQIANNQSAKLISNQEEIDDESIDLELESKRLELDYNNNWLAYEGFHLEEAFSSQESKIEVEWAKHEANYLSEYNKNKSKLLGYINLDDNKVDRSAHDNRWQHPEKQKTLIHTAPVLSPSSKESNKTTTFSNNTSKRYSASYIKHELEKLDEEHANEMIRLHNQKFAAKRWLTRQRIRLVSQANEVNNERKYIAQLLAQELLDYQHMKQVYS